MFNGLIPRVRACGLILLLLCLPALAQSPNGEINGTVMGPDGAGLPGAMIRIRSQSGGETIRLAAGSHGLYRAPGLLPGRYEMQAEIEGYFPTLKANLDLTAGEVRQVDFELAPSTRKEVVSVIGAAPLDSFEASETRESPARDVGEALSETIGVSQLRKGGIANDVVVRGFQSRDMNTLIDGQRIYGACPNHMDPAIFHVDFAEVDRVEIGKGPFDIRNQGSMGGTVNIITRKPSPGFRAFGSISGGSYGYINPSGTASYANDRLSVLGGYSYRTSGPYTDGSGKLFTQYGNYRADSQESDAFRIGTAWGKLTLAPRSSHSAQLSYTRQEADHVLYPYLLMDALYDNADRINFAYQIHDLPGPIRAIRLQGYFTQVHHWMTDVFRASSNGMARDYSMGTLAKTQVEGAKGEVGLGPLTVGVEVFRRFWRTTTQMAGMGYSPQESIPDVSSISGGAYAEVQKSLSDRWKFSGGGRVDRVRSTADPAKANTNLYYAYNGSRLTSATDILPAGNMRLSYSRPSGLVLSAGVGHSGRVPDAVERYYALRRSGTDWVGNPALNPSRNTGMDSSIAYRYRGIYMRSGLYFNWIRDFITVINKTKSNSLAGIMNTAARSYENIPARIYGGELFLVYTLSRRLSLTSASAYARGEQDPDPVRGIYSKILPEMPPLNSRDSLRYDTGRFFVEAEGLFASPQSRVNADLREQATPGYGIANLKVGIAIRKIEIRIILNNILNKDYVEPLSFQRDPFRSGVRVHEPGRNLFVSLSYRR
jgi:iron complex outermembrane recepter protein